MFAAGYQPGVDLRYGPGMLWRPGPVNNTLREQASDESWRSEDSWPYYAALEPTRRSVSEATLKSSAVSIGNLRAETTDWGMYEELWEGSEQLQLTARRYASESDSVQLGNFASPPAAATVLQNFGDSPQHTTSDMSTNTMFVDDMHFEPPGPSSPPPPEYHDFLQGIVLGLQSDTDSLVTAQQSLEHQQQQVPPIMAPADPSASETSESFDDVNIEDLFMEADTLVAATQGDIIAASLPQQVPTAASLAALDQTGSAQLDVRHQSSTPDSIHHQSAPSSVQVRRAGEKRKSRRASPLARADVPSISPALSQTRHGWPARKRRSEDESSAAQPNAAPTAHPTLPETARLRPAKRQKVAQSSSANKARVPDATPARKRVVKRAARPPSSFPELSQQEIAQARADGMVWARLGSYEAWPAQVQQPTAEQMNLLPRQSRPIPIDSSFVMFFGQHDFNVVNDSRITVSFEDGLRRCRARRGSALSTAVSEAVDFIKARLARGRQTPALIGR